MSFIEYTLLSLHKKMTNFWGENKFPLFYFLKLHKMYTVNRKNTI